MAAPALSSRGIVLASVFAVLIRVTNGQGLPSKGGAPRIAKATRQVQAPQAPVDPTAVGLALDDAFGDALSEPEGAAISLMQEGREKIRARSSCRSDPGAETPSGDNAAGSGDAALAAAASDGLEDGAAAISLVQNSGRVVLPGRSLIGGAVDDDPGCVDRSTAGLTQAVDSNIVDMMLAEEMEMSLTQAGADLEHPTESRR